MPMKMAGGRQGAGTMKMREEDVGIACDHFAYFDVLSFSEIECKPDEALLSSCIRLDYLCVPEMHLVVIYWDNDMVYS